MFYKIQSNIKIFCLFAGKQTHFSKLCNIIVLFISINFFGMLESTISATHCILFSVVAIRNICFYPKNFIPRSFSASMFKTHNLFSLVFVLVVMMFCSICQVTFTPIKRLFEFEIITIFTMQTQRYMCLLLCQLSDVCINIGMSYTDIQT